MKKHNRNRWILIYVLRCIFIGHIATSGSCATITPDKYTLNGIPQFSSFDENNDNTEILKQENDNIQDEKNVSFINEGNDDKNINNYDTITFNNDNTSVNKELNTPIKIISLTQFNDNTTIGEDAEELTKTTEKALGKVQNATSIYLAGYDDEIIKLKNDIQEEGEGHEIVIYFYLYKDLKYYKLGCAYTNTKILQECLLKYTHYFCLENKFLINPSTWCLDNIGIKTFRKQNETGGNFIPQIISMQEASLKSEEDKFIFKTEDKNRDKSYSLRTNKYYPNKKSFDSYEFILPEEKGLISKDINIDIYKTNAKKQGLGIDIDKIKPNMTNTSLNFFKKENVDDKDRTIYLLKEVERPYPLNPAQINKFISLSSVKNKTKDNIQHILEDSLSKTIVPSLTYENTEKEIPAAYSIKNESGYKNETIIGSEKDVEITSKPKIDIVSKGSVYNLSSQVPLAKPIINLPDKINNLQHADNIISNENIPSENERYMNISTKTVPNISSQQVKYYLEDKPAELESQNAETIVPDNFNYKTNISYTSKNQPKLREDYIKDIYSYNQTLPIANKTLESQNLSSNLEESKSISKPKYSILEYPIQTLASKNKGEINKQILNDNHPNKEQINVIDVYNKQSDRLVGIPPYSYNFMNKEPTQHQPYLLPWSMLSSNYGKPSKYKHKYIPSTKPDIELVGLPSISTDTNLKVENLYASADNNKTPAKYGAYQIPYNTITNSILPLNIPLPFSTQSEYNNTYMAPTHKGGTTYALPSFQNLGIVEKPQQKFDWKTLPSSIYPYLNKKRIPISAASYNILSPNQVYPGTDSNTFTESNQNNIPLKGQSGYTKPKESKVNLIYPEIQNTNKDNIEIQPNNDLLQNKKIGYNYEKPVSETEGELSVSYSKLKEKVLNAEYEPTYKNYQTMKIPYTKFPKEKGLVSTAIIAPQPTVDTKSAIELIPTTTNVTNKKPSPDVSSTISTFPIEYAPIETTSQPQMNETGLKHQPTSFIYSPYTSSFEIMPITKLKPVRVPYTIYSVPNEPKSYKAYEEEEPLSGISYEKKIPSTINSTRLDAFPSYFSTPKTNQKFARPIHKPQVISTADLVSPTTTFRKDTKKIRPEFSSIPTLSIPSSLVPTKVTSAPYFSDSTMRYQLIPGYNLPPISSSKISPILKPKTKPDFISSGLFKPLKSKPINTDFEQNPLLLDNLPQWSTVKAPYEGNLSSIPTTKGLKSNEADYINLLSSELPSKATIRPIIFPQKSVLPKTISLIDSLTKPISKTGPIDNTFMSPISESGLGLNLLSKDFKNLPRKPIPLNLKSFSMLPSLQKFQTSDFLNDIPVETKTINILPDIVDQNYLPTTPKSDKILYDPSKLSPIAPNQFYSQEIYPFKPRQKFIHDYLPLKTKQKPYTLQHSSISPDLIAKSIYPPKPFPSISPATTPITYPLSNLLQDKYLDFNLKPQSNILPKLYHQSTSLNNFPNLKYIPIQDSLNKDNVTEVSPYLPLETFQNETKTLNLNDSKLLSEIFPPYLTSLQNGSFMLPKQNYNLSYNFPSQITGPLEQDLFSPYFNKSEPIESNSPNISKIPPEIELNAYSEIPFANISKLSQLAPSFLNKISSLYRPVKPITKDMFNLVSPNNYTIGYPSEPTQSYQTPTQTEFSPMPPSLSPITKYSQILPENVKLNTLLPKVLKGFPTSFSLPPTANAEFISRSFEPITSSVPVSPPVKPSSKLFTPTPPLLPKEEDGTKKMISPLLNLPIPSPANLGSKRFQSTSPTLEFGSQIFPSPISPLPTSPTTEICLPCSKRPMSKFSSTPIKYISKSLKPSVSNLPLVSTAQIGPISFTSPISTLPVTPKANLVSTNFPPSISPTDELSAKGVPTSISSIPMKPTAELSSKSFPSITSVSPTLPTADFSSKSFKPLLSKIPPFPSPERLYSEKLKPLISNLPLTSEIYPSFTSPISTLSVSPNENLGLINFSSSVSPRPKLGSYPFSPPILSTSIPSTTELSPNNFPLSITPLPNSSPKTLGLQKIPCSIFTFPSSSPMGLSSKKDMRPIPTILAPENPCSKSLKPLLDLPHLSNTNLDSIFSSPISSTIDFGFKSLPTPTSSFPILSANVGSNTFPSISTLPFSPTVNSSKSFKPLISNVPSTLSPAKFNLKSLKPILNLPPLSTAKNGPSGFISPLSAFPTSPTVNFQSTTSSAPISSLELGSQTFPSRISTLPTSPFTAICLPCSKRPMSTSLSTPIKFISKSLKPSVSNLPFLSNAETNPKTFTSHLSTLPLSPTPNLSSNFPPSITPTLELGSKKNPQISNIPLVSSPLNLSLKSPKTVTPSMPLLPCSMSTLPFSPTTKMGSTSLPTFISPTLEFSSKNFPTPISSIPIMLTTDSSSKHIASISPLPTPPLADVSSKKILPTISSLPILSTIELSTQKIPSLITNISPAPSHFNYNLKSLSPSISSILPSSTAEICPPSFISPIATFPYLPSAKLGIPKLGSYTFPCPISSMPVLSNATLDLESLLPATSTLPSSSPELSSKNFKSPISFIPKLSSADLGSKSFSPISILPISPTKDFSSKTFKPLISNISPVLSPVKAYRERLIPSVSKLPFLPSAQICPSFTTFPISLTENLGSTSFPPPFSPTPELDSYSFPPSISTMPILPAIKLDSNRFLSPTSPFPISSTATLRLESYPSDITTLPPSLPTRVGSKSFKSPISTMSISAPKIPYSKVPKPVIASLPSLSTGKICSKKFPSFTSTSPTSPTAEFSSKIFKPLVSNSPPLTNTEIHPSFTYPSSSLPFLPGSNLGSYSFPCPTSSTPILPAMKLSANRFPTSVSPDYLTAKFSPPILSPTEFGFKNFPTLISSIPTLPTSELSSNILPSFTSTSPISETADLSAKIFRPQNSNLPPISTAKIGPISSIRPVSTFPILPSAKLGSMSLPLSASPDVSLKKFDTIPSLPMLSTTDLDPRTFSSISAMLTSPTTDLSSKSLKPLISNMLPISPPVNLYQERLIPSTSKLPLLSTAKICPNFTSSLSTLAFSPANVDSTSYPSYISPTLPTLSTKELGSNVPTNSFPFNFYTKSLKPSVFISPPCAEFSPTSVTSPVSTIPILSSAKLDSTGYLSPISSVPISSTVGLGSKTFPSISTSPMSPTYLSPKRLKPIISNIHPITSPVKLYSKRLRPTVSNLPLSSSAQICPSFTSSLSSLSTSPIENMGLTSFPPIVSPTPELDSYTFPPTISPMPILPAIKLDSNRFLSSTSPLPSSSTPTLRLESFPFPITTLPPTLPTRDASKRFKPPISTMSILAPESPYSNVPKPVIPSLSSLFTEKICQNFISPLPAVSITPKVGLGSKSYLPTTLTLPLPATAKLSTSNFLSPSSTVLTLTTAQPIPKSFEPSIPDISTILSPVPLHSKRLKPSISSFPLLSTLDGWSSKSTPFPYSPTVEPISIEDSYYPQKKTLVSPMTPSNAYNLQPFQIPKSYKPDTSLKQKNIEYTSNLKSMSKPQGEIYTELNRYPSFASNQPCQYSFQPESNNFATFIKPKTLSTPTGFYLPFQSNMELMATAQSTNRFNFNYDSLPKLKTSISYQDLSSNSFWGKAKLNFLPEDTNSKILYPPAFKPLAKLTTLTSIPQTLATAKVYEPSLLTEKPAMSKQQSKYPLPYVPDIATKYSPFQLPICKLYPFFPSKPMPTKFISAKNLPKSSPYEENIINVSSQNQFPNEKEKNPYLPLPYKGTQTNFDTKYSVGDFGYSQYKPKVTDHLFQSNLSPITNVQDRNFFKDKGQIAYPMKVPTPITGFREPSNFKKAIINKLIPYLQTDGIKNKEIIPIDEIEVAKYEPGKYKESNIKTDNPDIDLKTWISTVKILKAKLVIEADEVSAVNFVPIVKNFAGYTPEIIENTVKCYVKEHYGEPVIIKGVYDGYKPLAFIDDVKYSKYGIYIIWPTYYEYGRCRSGC